jgi:aspartyl-tRNA(Asn)/glutamyl-tRNA(Gln) amidotransferase subunit C
MIKPRNLSTGATAGKQRCIIRCLPNTLPTQENGMALTRSQVENIASLARLEITEDEIPAYVGNLSRIIDFVDQLENASTDHVEPMAHPLNMSQPLRADEVTEKDHRDRFQENASRVEAGLYLVPKVIE